MKNKKHALKKVDLKVDLDKIDWKKIIKQHPSAKTTTFLHDEEIVVVDEDLLDMLRKAAKKDPLKRARFCLHRSSKDHVQEMIIVLHKDTYVKPHRHVKKTESFHIIEGEITIIFFNDNGEVTRRLRMGPRGGSLPFVYRLSSDYWHTVVPHSEFAVFHETTTGPFTPLSSEFPDWAPDEDEKQKIIKFLKDIVIVK